MDRLGCRSHLVAVASLYLGAACLMAGGYVSPACAQDLPARSGGKSCPIREATVVVFMWCPQRRSIPDRRPGTFSFITRIDRPSIHSTPSHCGRWRLPGSRS
jgi:hypothetical protein